MTNSFLSGPIAPYRNVPIQSQFYAPNFFYISEIERGSTTVITTTENINFYIGQQVRLIIPNGYGATQLNEQTGYVLDYVTPTEEIPDFIMPQPSGFDTYAAGVLSAIHLVYPEAFIIPGTFTLNFNGTPDEKSVFRDNGVGGIEYVSGVTGLRSGTLDYETGFLRMRFNPHEIVASATAGDPTILVLNFSPSIFIAGQTVLITGMGGGSWPSLVGNTYDIVQDAIGTLYLDVSSVGFGNYIGNSGAVTPTVPQQTQSVTCSFQWDRNLDPDPPTNAFRISIDSTNADPFLNPDFPNKAQVLAIGDINSGPINSTGRNNQGTFIPGSFINISPN